MVRNTYIEISTSGHDEIVDITSEVKHILNNHNLKNGLVHIFIPGATGALTTIEVESGLIDDFTALLRQLIPDLKNYKHNLAWGDGNAHSHLRASLIGPSLTVPVENNRLVLGTWQQIVFLDFDNRSRNRNLFCQLIGDFK